MIEYRTRSRPAALLSVGAVALLGVQMLAATPTLAQSPHSKVWGKPGRYQFTAPAGVTSITATVTGGGGGGGGHFTDTDGPKSPAEVVAGSGGGGGATASCTLQIPPGGRVIIEVGAGGAGGATGNSGIDAENSFSGVTTGKSIDAKGFGVLGGDGGGKHDGPHGDPLVYGGRGGSFDAYDSPACTQRAGSDGEPGGSATPAVGGAAGRPATGCPVDAGQGGRGAALNESSGQPGKAGCVVITY